MLETMQLSADWAYCDALCLKIVVRVKGVKTTVQKTLNNVLTPLIAVALSRKP